MDIIFSENVLKMLFNQFQKATLFCYALYTHLQRYAAIIICKYYLAKTSQNVVKDPNSRQASGMPAPNN